MKKYNTKTIITDFYVDWKKIADCLHARGLIIYEQYSEIMKTFK